MVDDPDKFYNMNHNVVLSDIIDKLNENIIKHDESYITKIYESDKHKKFFNHLYIISFLKENIINVENVDDWSYEEIKNAFIAIKEINKMVDKLNQ